MPPSCCPPHGFCAGNAEQLQQLLAEEGCDVNQADEEGRTALHFAGEQQQQMTSHMSHSEWAMAGVVVVVAAVFVPAWPSRVQAHAVNPPA